MPASYHRVVNAKQGCAERFERLMQAYAAFARACCERSRVSVHRSPVHPQRFVVHEVFPDARSLRRVRSKSHFEQLWLPVILSLIDDVETYSGYEEGVRPGK